MADRPTCATCRFYDEKLKLCRHDPPVAKLRETTMTGAMNLLPTYEVVGTWPPTGPEAWCGQHSAETPDHLKADTTLFDQANEVTTTSEEARQGARNRMELERLARAAGRRRPGTRKWRSS